MTSSTHRALALAFLMAFSLPMFTPLAAAQGEDGTVAVTSPTNGQTVTYYTGNTQLSITCTTSKTPQVDPEFGGAGMAFAVRQAGVGGFNFGQGWDSTSPYTVTRTMDQWGITNTGNHEVRCRIYNGGLYYWATRTFNVVAAPSGEDGSVTMTSPSSGQSVTYYTSSTPLTISCTTTHTPQVDPEFGGAGMAFAVRQAGVGGFNFGQGWDSTSPYSVTQTMAQWGITNTGNHEARCRVYENGLYHWSTRTFNVVAAPSGEDGSVTMTSPSSGQSISGSTLTVTCTTTQTPQVDPEFGGAGMAFAVRPAGSGGFNFGQGWDSTSPYSVTQTMAQWGVTGPGSYEARCRVHENGLYHWSTRTFTVSTSDTLTGCTFTTTSSGLAVTATVDGTCQSSYGSPITFSWDWGDGATSPNAGSAPTHTYGEAYCPSGTATITLTATATGPSATSARTVSIVDSRDMDPLPGGGTGDGLVKCREDAQGTSDDNPDSDGDRLNDLVESEWYADRDLVFCNAAATNCFHPNATVRDMYVEVDWYQNRPFLQAAVDLIETAYANSGTGINVHIDIGTFGGGGTNLGANGNVDLATASANRNVNMIEERRGIFRYLVNACQNPVERPGWITYGVGETPGDDALIYDCRIADANRANDQAEEFMHEVGHTLFGARVILPDCDARSHQRNPDLDHFDGTDDSRRDCNRDGDPDGDGVSTCCWDFWPHSSDANDAMISGGPAAKNAVDYADASWEDIKLDWGISGVVPDCVQALPIDTSLVPPYLPTCDGDEAPAAGLLSVEVPQTSTVEEWLDYLAGKTEHGHGHDDE